MAELVTVEELASHLRISDAQLGRDLTLQGLLTSILAGVKDAFERSCNREGVPFQDAQSNREEIHDGSGSATLFLDYAPAAIDSIAIGPDEDEPDEELDPTDADVVRWVPGSRELQRVAGYWGEKGVKAAVRITYDSQADLPGLAKQAVLRACAIIYRQLGSEDVVSESQAGYSRTLQQLESPSATMGDPIWRLGVEKFTRHAAI